MSVSVSPRLLRSFRCPFFAFLAFWLSPPPVNLPTLYGVEGLKHLRTSNVEQDGQTSKTPIPTYDKTKPTASPLHPTTLTRPSTIAFAFSILLCSVQLGIGGLVTQLREPNVNGVPLLFQAVTNLACFEAAKKVGTLSSTHSTGSQLIPKHQSPASVHAIPCSVFCVLLSSSLGAY